MRTINKMFRNLPLVACFLLANAMYGQATVLSESMGSVGGTTAIATHETANGFDNDVQTMTGTADVRNTLASSGYAGASGAGNIFVTNVAGRFFQIEGINTTGIVGLQLSFGLHKSTNASNGSDFLVEVSTDGVNYTALSYGPLLTGSGTSVWKKITATGTIPSTSNLRIRFRQTGTATQYRVDDVLLTGASCSASITADGPTSFCIGDDVTLTASAGTSYLWSTSETTQSITVSETGWYAVTVTDSNDCTASDSIQVLIHPTPIITVTALNDTVCEGDTLTLTARLLLPDLIISEYVEGSGNEKYVEIYNGTGNTVNLADYHYQAFHNGVSIPTFDFALSGTLADGDVLVLKNASATLYTGVATIATGIQHNGNDAIALYNTVNGEFVDILGSIGHDPGTEWTGTGGYGTRDHTLARNTDVYVGILVNPNLAGTLGFPALTSEWTQSAQDDVSGLGAHSISCNFTWSPATIPSTGCTVQAVPSSNEVYTATGTFGNGCTAFGVDSVVVDSCNRERSATAGSPRNANSNVTIYPNPFNASTMISFNVPKDNNHVSVEVLDINGKPVVNLFNGNMDSGNQLINWDGNNTFGSRAAQGIYICRIMIGAEMTTVRLLLQ